MTGQGPKLQPGERQPNPDLDAAASLAHQFYLDGQQSVTRGGYDAGKNLGHDVGFGARQDTRAFVHGVMDGFAQGTEARHDLADSLTRPEKELEAG